MPPRPVVNDVLWRCLCPSFHPPGTLIRPAKVGARLIAHHQPSRSLAAPTCSRTQLRSFNAAADAPAHPSALPEARDSKRQSSQPNRSSHRSTRGKPSLVHLPTVELYERLRIDGAAGRHEEVMRTVRILIKDRRERPNAAMYSAILHSFADPEAGTAGKVRKMLEDMREEGIELDARGCHCVIEALAVHPDYLLRTEILEYMKERWFALSDRGHNMVVAGLLRDRMFEQALEKMDDMLKRRIRVEGWLWDKAMWMLLEFGETEEAFHVVELRQGIQEQQGLKLSNALWLELLDHAAKLHLVEAVNMIWGTQVTSGYIKPATGTCMNVLTVASRTGNVGIATDVFRVLTERETVLQSHHYELLIEAYLNARDLGAALNVAVIIQESNLKVDTATVHPLFVYLKQKEGRPMEAFRILQNFEARKKKVPTAAVNACIQASVFLERLDEAIEIYKALHTVSNAGPNTATFNALFRGCSMARRKELAMFLANEMVQLGLKPDALSYDRLILVCCTADDLHDAWLYYEEMRDSGLVPRKGTFEALITKATAKGDAKAVAAMKDMKGCGLVPKREVERLVRDGFEEGKMDRENTSRPEITEGASREEMLEAASAEQERVNEAA